MRALLLSTLLLLTACSEEEEMVVCSCTCTCGDDSEAFAESTCVASDEATCCDVGCDEACTEQTGGSATAVDATCEPAPAATTG